MPANDDALSFLLDLNEELASLEEKGATVQPPGPPSSVKDLATLLSKDRMEAPQSSAHRFGAAKGKNANRRE